MKITGITTTALHIPEIATAQDATMFRPASGQTIVFVEIATDKGHDAFLLEEPEFAATLNGFLNGCAEHRGLPIR